MSRRERGRRRSNLRSLGHLLGSDAGRRFLHARGVFTSVESFTAALSPPMDERLSGLAHIRPGAAVVYTGQQLQCDYQHSVTGKFHALHELAGLCETLMLPLDMDRAGSSRRNTTLSWPGGVGGDSIRLISHRFADVEMRFAPLEPARLELVLATVRRWVSGHRGGSLSDADELRLESFSDALLADPTTLAGTNRALTSWLLAEGLDLEPRMMIVSDLVGTGYLTARINDVVALVDDVVTVFNAAVDDLQAGDVDPQVPRLSEQYLPLWYACPRDGLRRRMVHERHHGERFATSRCRCGAEYRFYLGDAKATTIDEIVATGRWSLDVTLPIYVNDLVSGAVVGRSSALYGLVLNEVIAKVLGGRPVPLFVPDRLAQSDLVGPGDSLFYECLTRRR